MDDRHRARDAHDLPLVAAHDRSVVERRTTPATIVPRNGTDAIALLFPWSIVGSPAPPRRLLRSASGCRRQPPQATSGSGPDRLFGSPQGGEAIGLIVARDDWRPAFPADGARTDASTPFPDDGARADGSLGVCDRIRSARINPLDVARSSPAPSSSRGWPIVANMDLCSTRMFRLPRPSWDVRRTIETSRDARR